MTQAHILVVDDEQDICDLIQITLSQMGLNAHCAHSIASAKQLLGQHRFDACLTDLRLEDGSGLELVELITSQFAHCPVAVITAHGNMETAILALKKGAFDFVCKPVELHHLRNLVQGALKVRLSHAKGRDEHTTCALLGNSAPMNRLREMITKVARSQAPVYIRGPSGSGKELVARIIHATSARADGPFIPVNCGAIPQDLMESEFFGHEKGSFTGALAAKKGLFQAAHKGTLFLDEVADLPLDMQVKLLRAIQEKAVRPLGQPQEVPVDCRILSASQKDLNALVQQHVFREDLYYRLNVIEIKVPSLHERKEDIPLLADHILTRLSQLHHREKIQLDAKGLARLTEYTFPGNVRELENILERAMTLCDQTTLNPQSLQLPSHLPRPYPISESENLEEYLHTIERSTILDALEKTQGNKTQAAQLLGISFRALRYRLKKLGLP